VKILHIDDSTEICDMYADMFTADDSTIKSVNDGKEGLEIIIKNDYDLILLDMCMPKYSGLDFLHDLKNKRPSELKKVVIVSLLDLTEEHVKELLDLGIHSIEPKPTDFQSMVNIQRKILLK